MPDKRDEARKSLQKALEVNPSSLEAHALLAGAGLRRRQARRSSSRKSQKVLAIAPNYGEVYRVAGELAAHNYRFDEAVDARAQGARARSEQRAQRCPTSASICCAPATRPGARSALEQSFKLIIATTVVTYNLLQMMDTLDKFVTVRDGDFILRMDKDEAPVLQDYGDARSRTRRSTRCRSATSSRRRVRF